MTSKYAAATVPLKGVIRISGSVTPAAPGGLVLIQRKTTTGWVTWTRRLLNASSAYVAALPAGTVQRVWVLRVVKPAAGRIAVGASAARAVYVTGHKFALALAESTSSTIRSGKVTLSGKLTPAVAGRTVSLYDTRGGDRVRVATAVTTATGAYTATVTPASPGTHAFSALIGGYGWYLGAWSTQTPKAWVTTEILGTGETLAAGDWIASPDGRYRLVMQWDGNLVEYVLPTMRAVWASGTAGAGTSRAVMQSDGNLVLYNAGGATWSSHTSGNPAWLVVQGDSNLVVYSPTKSLWSSATINDRLLGGETLHSGQSITSADGGTTVVMQADGNLVVYKNGGGALWASGHNAVGNWAVMQYDGNLVLYSASNVALWSSGTAGRDGAVAVAQNDTNFVVYQGGTAYWASNSNSGGGSGIVTGVWPGAGGPVAANSHYGYPYPSSPDCTEVGSLAGCVVDKWLFYQGQCTSWTAYRLSQMNGFAFANGYGGKGNWGDATHWGTQAGTLGIAVNGTPAVGSVAWYSSGHVAYVEAVNSPTSVVISEMNYDLHNGFQVHTITTSSGWPTGFIHIHDR